MTVRVTREAEPQIELYGAFSGELVGGGKRTLTFTPTGTYLTMVVKNSLSKVQVEQGGFKTSYIPTTGASATRAADVASIPVSAFGYNSGAGTVVVDFSRDHLSTDYAQIVSLDDGSLVDRTSLALSSGAGRRYRVDVYDNSVSQLSNTNVGDGTSSEMKMALAFAENDFAALIDGGTVATDTNGTLPSASTLVIGDRSQISSPINGHIKSIQYYPRRLTNAQLQELTT
jgi:hypothetical protein